MNKRHKSFDYIVSSYFSTNDRTSTCTGLEQANLNTNHIGGQTKSFQEQGDRRLLYYLLSCRGTKAMHVPFRSMVEGDLVRAEPQRGVPGADVFDGDAGGAVEVSIASTSRCGGRLPETRRVLSRPIGTPSFVLLASRGQKSTRRAQSRPLRLDLSPPWLGSRRQVPIAGSDWKGSRMAASRRRTG